MSARAFLKENTSGTMVARMLISGAGDLSWTLPKVLEPGPLLKIRLLSSKLALQGLEYWAKERQHHYKADQSTLMRLGTAESSRRADAWRSVQDEAHDSIAWIYRRAKDRGVNLLGRRGRF